MDDVDERRALRQRLRDEAAWRAFVEDELAREAEKARIWRRRADERAARIQRLVGGRTVRSALLSWISRPAPPAVHVPHDDEVLAVAPVTTPTRTAPVPSHPEVRAATLVTTPSATALAREMDSIALDDDLPAALRDADVLVVERIAWDEADRELRERVTERLDDDVRPPLLWIGDVDDPVEPLVRPRDIVTGRRHGRARRMLVEPWATPLPITGVPRVGATGRWVEDGDTRSIVSRTGPLVATCPNPHTALGLALAGTPVVGEGGEPVHGLPGPRVRLDVDGLGHGAPAPDTLRTLAIRQRRQVATTATAAHRVDHLLDALDVPVTVREQRLAALLSSNRPALVPARIDELGRQRRRPDELRCALHGGADGAAVRAVEEAAERAGLELHLTTPSAEVPLGTVLNRLAEVADAALLAKIDDDDHYGPAHLLDATTALRLTNADLVGKKAHYVQLTDEDSGTWLIAGDAEDQWATQGLMGATFVWRRALHDRLPFAPRPRRVDSLYVRAAAAAGARMWAVPANDFAYVRPSGGRTNIAGGSYVRARGEPVGRGLALAVVDV